jgi:hypothetical protein
MPRCVCRHDVQAHAAEMHIDGPDEDETVFPCDACACADYEPELVG